MYRFNILDGKGEILLIYKNKSSINKKLTLKLNPMRTFTFSKENRTFELLNLNSNKMNNTINLNEDNMKNDCPKWIDINSMYDKDDNVKKAELFKIMNDAKLRLLCSIDMNTETEEESDEKHFYYTGIVKNGTNFFDFNLLEDYFENEGIFDLDLNWVVNQLNNLLTSKVKIAIVSRGNLSYLLENIRDEKNGKEKLLSAIRKLQEELFNKGEINCNTTFYDCVQNYGGIINTEYGRAELGENGFFLVDETDEVEFYNYDFNPVAFYSKANYENYL